MKLGIDTLRDPTNLLNVWKNLSEKPFGKELFSRMLGFMAPYSGTISPRVVEVAPGYARVQIRDRWGVRNHLKSIHAVALMNLGEATTGLAVLSRVPAGGRGIVLELGMEYLKKARGTITAEARVDLPDAPGTHDIVVTGELRNSIGETVARARARWRVELPQARAADDARTEAPAGSEPPADASDDTPSAAQ